MEIKFYSSGKWNRSEEQTPKLTLPLKHVSRLLLEEKTIIQSCLAFIVITVRNACVVCVKSQMLKLLANSTIAFSNITTSTI